MTMDKNSIFRWRSLFPVGLFKRIADGFGDNTDFRGKAKEIVPVLYGRSLEKRPYDRRIAFLGQSNLHEPNWIR
jgi:hypothetical protein